MQSCHKKRAGCSSEYGERDEGVSGLPDQPDCLGRADECSQRSLRDTSGDWKTAPAPQTDKKSKGKPKSKVGFIGKALRTFGLCLLTSSMCGLSDEPKLQIFRTVSDKELAEINATGTYGFNANSSGKYFAASLSGAEAIQKQYGGTITKTAIPQSVYFSGYAFNDTGGAGHSIHFENSQLPSVYATMDRISILKR